MIGYALPLPTYQPTYQPSNLPTNPLNYQQSNIPIYQIYPIYLQMSMTTQKNTNLSTNNLPTKQPSGLIQIKA